MGVKSIYQSHNRFRILNTAGIFARAAQIVVHFFNKGLLYMCGIRNVKLLFSAGIM